MRYLTNINLESLSKVSIAWQELWNAINHLGEAHGCLVEAAPELSEELEGIALGMAADIRLIDGKLLEIVDEVEEIQHSIMLPMLIGVSKELEER